jgi:putative flippase GtrA
VQRVDATVVVDGASRGHQRLSRHLASEHPLALLVGALPSEDVDFDGLEVEEFHECVKGGGHLLIVARHHYDWRVPIASAVADRARSPFGRKAFRYAMVSVVSVAVSQVCLFALYALAHWKARDASIAAGLVGGVPSYVLNRRWTWGKTGRSHLWREVVPFWVLAVVGLVFSTVVADLAEGWAHDLSDRRLVQALVVNGSSIAAFGTLWVGKFVIFNKLLFVADDDLRAALADEVVA